MDNGGMAVAAAAFDRTVFPPSDRPQLAAVAEALTAAARAKLVGPDGREVVIPDEVYQALLGIVQALEQGRAVTIAPQDTLLTTQQAADLLNIARPTLVRLLEAGEIPHSIRGRHRRVRLADIVDYRERTRRARRDALREMTADLGDDYDTVDGFVATR